MVSEGVSVCCKRKDLFVPSARKSILKKRKAEISSLPWVTPKKVCDDDGDSKSVEKDLSGRCIAIDEYLAREKAEGGYGEAKAAKCSFKNTEVVHFELLSTPKEVKGTVVMEEVFRDVDPLEPFAARVVDRLMDGHTALITLQKELSLYHKVHGDRIRTVEDLHKFACEQARDLMERCEGRLPHLPEKPQFNIRAEMKSTNWVLNPEKEEGRIPHLPEKPQFNVWGEMEPSPKEKEDAYHEKLLTRLPDALCQRFLKVRVTSFTVGLDATKRTLSTLGKSVLPGLMGALPVHK
jgi:hypothetical protein